MGLRLGSLLCVKKRKRKTLPLTDHQWPTQHERYTNIETSWTQSNTQISGNAPAVCVLAFGYNNGLLNTTSYPIEYYFVSYSRDKIKMVNYKDILNNYFLITFYLKINRH